MQMPCEFHAKVLSLRRSPLEDPEVSSSSPGFRVPWFSASPCTVSGCKVLPRGVHPGVPPQALAK